MDQAGEKTFEQWLRTATQEEKIQVLEAIKARLGDASYQGRIAGHQD